MALSSSPATAIKVMVSPWPLWQVLKRLQNEPSLRPQGRANVGFPNRTGQGPEPWHSCLLQRRQYDKHQSNLLG